MLEAFTSNGTTRDSQVLTKVQCTSIGEPGCEKEKFFQYNALLGMCDNTLTTDCVVNVQAKDSAGKNQIGKFVEIFQERPHTLFLEMPRLDYRQAQAHS
jgi:hypothetical protein